MTSKTIHSEVRAALERRPEADARWIQAAVAARKPEAAEMSLRSFNATYVLPIKRERKSRNEREALVRHSEPRVQELVRVEMKALLRDSVEAGGGELVDLVGGLNQRADHLVEEIFRCLTLREML